ncbi:MAG: sulfatase [Planctomycetota bacterium]
MRALFTLGALAALAASAAAVQDQRDARPNLVLLVTDDHPHDALGCAGHPVLLTPHIDALAARGVRFTRAFVTTPICAASRASLLTGQYERRHGYTFGAPPLASETVDATYPVLLREAGYRVGFVGKLGVRIPGDARARMFDSFAGGTLPYFRKAKEGEDRGRHLTDRNVDRAIAFALEEDERPFCLSLWFQAPHAEDANPEQYLWPARLDGLYADAEIPAPALSDPAFFDALPEFLRTGLNRERWYWRFDTPEKRTRMTRGYFRMLSAVDEGIGRLVAALEEAGRLDDTVIVLIGDNGYFLGERGYAGKWTMHDRSTRVPLVVCDPRADPGRRGVTQDAFALNVDVAPTLLDLAGIEAPEDVQGRTLRPLLDGEEVEWRGEVLTEHLWTHPKIPRTEGVRTDRWKYVRYLDHPEFEEIYDLRDDPDEGRNLARAAEQEALLWGLRGLCARAIEAVE